MDVAVREIELNGERLTVYAGIHRTQGGWRVKATATRPARQFSDGKEGAVASLADATAWVQGKPTRDRYDMDLTRVETRKMTLTRRFRSGAAAGNSAPRFDLEVSPSRSVNRASWMRVYLGSATTLTQERIDDAIATLHARWSEYRKLLDRYGRERVLFSTNLTHALRKLQVASHPDAALRPYPTRLLLSDVLAWTGNGDGIGFTPARTVQPDRMAVFWPERPNGLDVAWPLLLDPETGLITRSLIEGQKSA